MLRRRKTGVYMRTKGTRWAHWNVRIRTIDRERRMGVTRGNQCRVVRRSWRGNAPRMLGKWLTALEVGRRGRNSVEVDSFASTYLVKACQVKAWNVAFQERITEGDLTFDEFCVATEGKGLSVAVFLLAGDTRCRASSTFWMLGIALREIGTMSVGTGEKTEICGR